MVPRVALIMYTSPSQERGLLAGISQYVRTHNRWSLYVQSHWMDNPEGLASWKGDGIIAYVNNSHLLEAIRQTGLPTVNVAEGLEQPLIPAVLPDNHAIGRLVAQAFLDNGFTNFAFSGINTAIYSNERMEGFEKTIQAQGYKCYRCHGDEEYDWNEPPKGLEDSIRALPKPVGLFACFDARARQVVETCHNQGIAVPEEVAVIGVNDDELICNLAEVPLSSVSLRSEQRGYEAARMLDQLMAGQRVEEVIRIGPQHVVTRRSSDMLAIDDPEVAQAVRYIRLHATEPIGVQHVVDKVLVSRRSLERRFRRILGRTPSDEITRVRVERARQLLDETDLPMTQIASASGLGDAVNLSRVFKRKTGMTPSQCREKRYLSR
ncbi:MAG: DNA-binding transcriptional regulator [Phycisphaeraceae bacterium]|nr:DNA-binding transcriptional regulator [Phycisphaeraceae bacterium]